MNNSVEGATNLNESSNEEKLKYLSNIDDQLSDPYLMQGTKMEQHPHFDEILPESNSMQTKNTAGKESDVSHFSVTKTENVKNIGEAELHINLPSAKNIESDIVLQNQSQLKLHELPVDPDNSLIEPYSFSQSKLSNQDEPSSDNRDMSEKIERMDALLQKSPTSSAEELTGLFQVSNIKSDYDKILNESAILSHSEYTELSHPLPDETKNETIKILENKTEKSHNNSDNLNFPADTNHNLSFANNSDKSSKFTLNQLVNQDFSANSTDRSSSRSANSIESLTEPSRIPQFSQDPEEPSNSSFQILEISSDLKKSNSSSLESSDNHPSQVYIPITSDYSNPQMIISDAENDSRKMSYSSSLQSFDHPTPQVHVSLTQTDSSNTAIENALDRSHVAVLPTDLGDSNYSSSVRLSDQSINSQHIPVIPIDSKELPDALSVSNSDNVSPLPHITDSLIKSDEFPLNIHSSNHSIPSTHIQETPASSIDPSYSQTDHSVSLSHTSDISIDPILSLDSAAIRSEDHSISSPPVPNNMVDSIKSYSISYDSSDHPTSSVHTSNTSMDSFEYSSSPSVVHSSIPPISPPHTSDISVNSDKFSDSSSVRSPVRPSSPSHISDNSVDSKKSSYSSSIGSSVPPISPPHISGISVDSDKSLDSSSVCLPYPPFSSSNISDTPADSKKSSDSLVRPNSPPHISNTPIDSVKSPDSSYSPHIPVTPVDSFESPPPHTTDTSMISSGALYSDYVNPHDDFNSTSFSQNIITDSNISSDQPPHCPSLPANSSKINIWKCVKNMLRSVITHPKVESLFYWRDPKTSGVVFVSILILLLSMAYYSVISVVANVGFLVLVSSMGFRIYKHVLQAVQKTQQCHPYSVFLDYDITLPKEKVHEIIDAALLHINAYLCELRRLFLVENWIESIKFAVVLWVLTYVGSWFNGLTLVIIAFVTLFTLPKVYENNKIQIDQNLALLQVKLEELTNKIRDVLPGLQRKKPVDKKE